MTDQMPEKGPVPVPDRAPKPGQDPAAATQDPSSRAAELMEELAQIRAAAVGRLVKLRVLKPHDSFTVGGVTVGASPTDVPAHAVARLTSAADEAGVKIEEV